MIFKKYGKSLFDAQVSLEPERSEARPLPAAETYVPTQEENTFQESEEPFDEKPDVLIAEGVSFKGELQFVNLLRLDGSFDGTIAKGKKIIIGPKGHLKANVQLEEAFIAGKVEGDLCLSKRLVLRGRAEVFGNITAPSLSVDEGVAIVGQLLVSTAKPQA